LYAPFSLTSEAGVAQTPVEGYIDVSQNVYPTVNTGDINENGKWTGVKSSDSEFIGLTIALAISNGGEALFPSTNNHPSINMSGFRDLFIAIKPTRGGTYNIGAVMGPDTVSFANLQPVAAGELLRVQNEAYDNGSPTFASVTSDNEVLQADAWNIFSIPRRTENQQNLQIKLTNSSGGNADIEFGFMRLV
jgi:hypothetical protein